MGTVLIVDDSALVRKQLSGVVEKLGFDIDTARNGREAVDKASQNNYSVITMDINMPVLDGVSAVKEIMAANPTPILMVSSLTTADASITIEAIENGAIDYVAKPGTMNVGLAQTGDAIEEKILSLSRIPKRRLRSRATRRPLPVRKTRASAPAPERRERRTSMSRTMNMANFNVERVVLIGASTGGPGLIEDICAKLPANFKYPVCIVQHMPEQFTATFASRLDRVSQLDVHEVTKTMDLVPGNIYLASGGTDLEFAKKVSGKIVVKTNGVPNGRFFKPSVDEMFLSAIKIFGGSNIFGVLLTGIGDDGAEGMVKVKTSGGYTLAESEETATVYGMPKVAAEQGGASEVLPFEQILKKIVTYK